MEELPIFSTSQETDKLDAAIAKMQSQLAAAIKDKTNPYFNSSYADLANIWIAGRDAMKTSEVALTQWPIHSSDERLHLVTRISHKGQWIMSRASLPVAKKDAHGYGSALTYLKRYALAAALGVAEIEDDDGNEAVNKSGKEERPAQGRASPPTVIESKPKSEQTVNAPKIEPVDYKKIGETRFKAGRLAGLSFTEAWEANRAKSIKYAQDVVDAGNQGEKTSEMQAMFVDYGIAMGYLPENFSGSLGGSNGK